VDHRFRTAKVLRPYRRSVEESAQSAPPISRLNPLARRVADACQGDSHQVDGLNVAAPGWSAEDPGARSCPAYCEPFFRIRASIAQRGVMTASPAASVARSPGARYREARRLSRGGPRSEFDLAHGVTPMATSKAGRI
jgi:hypothetical protein